jgi:MoaA/NifB/PqqE/SkfB family radical SAM enzyme
MYEHFRDLLKYSAGLGFEVQVDTNGLALRPNDYDLLDSHVSLISLPIDGPNSVSHDLMRGKSQQFERALYHLENLRKSRVRIKVNTVVSALNRKQIPALGALLATYRIDHWSLFQFWPLHSARAHSDHYAISDEEYHALVQELGRKPNGLHIETGTIKERQGYHCFVTHRGAVYTHHPHRHSEYRWLGSIFDDASIDAWKRIAISSIHPGARYRYIQLQNVNSIA